MQDFLIGAYLDEYRLEALLNRGGMARIYRALDVNLNRIVAIKVIDIPYQAEAEYVQRFRREAQAVAQLDTPHIVRLYRYGEAAAPNVGGSVLYMAMQYIEGSDLQYVLDSYRRDGELMELAQVNRILHELCDALDYAHAKGVVHRDIKPSNIMLDRQGRAILTDFGIAMLATQATQGGVFGSPHYIAPEQAQSSARAVPQSDLYSLGVILYEMLTGVLPFDAEEPLELALKHVMSPVPSPRSIRPEISKEMEAVLLKALAKRPEDRYPSGQALAGALVQGLATMKRRGLAPRRGLLDRIEQGWRERSSTVQDQLKAQAVPETGPILVPPAATATPAWQPPAPIPTSPYPLPGAGRSNRPLGLALGGVLLALLCLGLAVFLASRSLPGVFGAAPPGQPSATPTPTPDATLSSARTSAALALTQTFETANAPTETPTPSATPTETPTETPTVTPTPLTDYELTLDRRGEDKSFLLLTNTGDSDIFMGDLSLQAGKVMVPGAAWGAQNLAPGACVIALKADRKGNSLPGGVSCKPQGPIVDVPNSQADIFKSWTEVFFRGQSVGSCGQDKTSCTISFSK